MFRRSLRLLWVRVSCIALAIPALALPAAAGQQATNTTLLVDTRDVNGRTEATLFVAVTGRDGLPAAGAITITDNSQPLAGFALDAQGQTSPTIFLPGGTHSLRAIYAGDLTHAVSNSSVKPVSATSSSTPDFSVSIAPATLTLKQGQSGAALVSVTPENAASLTAPMFVTISCSGLPDQTSCTFTPENLEVPVGATAPITSSMVLATQSASLGRMEPLRRAAHPAIWAVLLPGSFTLAGLAFALRRHRAWSRLLLLALVALVTTLGATACSPLYGYRNHGPPQNRPTPPGTYNVTVAAQSSNGVSATTHTTTMALTVTQ